jgi:hypothetical protein
MTALMLISKTSEQGAGKSWGLSYAGINRGQVQRVFLSLDINPRSTPSLYGCRLKVKENAGNCKNKPLPAWQQTPYKTNGFDQAD